jgi:hypothetical protein
MTYRSRLSAVAVVHSFEFDRVEVPERAAAADAVEGIVERSRVRFPDVPIIVRGYRTRRSNPST